MAVPSADARGRSASCEFGLFSDGVGDRDLTYEAMELPSDPGLTVLVYTAEAASATHDALNLLVS